VNLKGKRSKLERIGKRVRREKGGKDKGKKGEGGNVKGERGVG